MSSRQTLDFGVGIVAIVRTFVQVDLVASAKALVAGGVTSLEVTMNTPGVLEAIPKIREVLGSSVTVGAGTILCREDAEKAIGAGAQFIVSPTFQPETIAKCNELGVPIVSGAMTPTEILATYNAGADYVKLFPAGVLGLEFIKAVLGPMPFLRIVPTGGVSLENLSQFLTVCPGVGVGSNMVSPKMMSEGDWDGLTALTKTYVEAASHR